MEAYQKKKVKSLGDEKQLYTWQDALSLQIWH
jgi:hypothetical protein